MTESDFKNVLTQFLNKYWSAFHEAIEAQSVTPQRLAGSLFEALQAEHRAFQSIYAGPARSALDGLGQIWHDLQIRRFQWQDPSLTRKEITSALRLFQKIYRSLLEQGRRYAEALEDILNHAPHGTPKDPLRPDAAR